ncbi:MAG: hypothetical protein QM817_36030 [Archangium sp.]
MLKQSLWVVSLLGVLSLSAACGPQPGPYGGGGGGGFGGGGFGGGFAGGPGSGPGGGGGSGGGNQTVTCGPSNCGGCCANNICQPGRADSACGGGGNVCSSCGGGMTCNSSGMCAASAPTCSPSNCNGCCSASGVCQPGTADSACGTGGGVCSTCTSAQFCGPSSRLCLTTPTSTTGSVKVVNHSTVTVLFIYLSPKSSSNWGPDQLGSRVLSPNGEFTMTSIPAGSYDLKACSSSTSCAYSTVSVVAGYVAVVTLI